MKKLLLSIFVLVNFTLYAQNELPIGQWRSHLPYRIGDYVAQSPDKIIFSTSYSLVFLDKEEMSTEFFTKVEGLSGVRIRFVEYNPLSDVLMVFYENSVIDLINMSDNTRDVTTLSQIANFNNFTGEKLLNNVFVENDSMVYLAANYGVSKVNISKNEFAFTTFTGINVMDIAIFEDNIYAATAEGIYRADVNNAFLEDFGNWTLLGPEKGFPIEYSCRALEVYEGKLYLDLDNRLYSLRSDQLNFVYEIGSSIIRFIRASSGRLYVGYPFCNSAGCFAGKILHIDAAGNIGELASGCYFDYSTAIEDEQGRVWIGANDRDFRMYPNRDANDCERFKLNSPWSAEVKEMTIANGQVWLASGGLNQTLSPRFLSHGFASLVDGQWTVYNRNTRDELKGVDPNDNNDDLLDIITVAVHPSNGKVYAGSFYEGLLEFDGENISLYNEMNSSISVANGDSQRSRISGLAFDEDENLWISNHLAINNEPISVLQPDGTFQSFQTPGCGSQTEIFQIDVDESNFKWAIVGRNSAAVMVFDNGPDVEDTSDDRCKLFTQNNSNLPTNNANCLQVDLEGDVWVGTTEGVVIFECGASVFDAACQGSRRIVEQDGFNAFLLETEDVQTIAVDGANRKWIGTKNGVFVLSPTGEEQVARFTVDNSPLLDNNIIDIAINPDNGEVFIGTNRGIVSYQADAVSGGRRHKPQITVYPNPVRPDYTGPIAMKGFARNANVKITDISGRLVFEGKALGGQFIWDGNDYNGRRANTGVYLIFGATDSRNAGFEDPDTVVGKILFIN